MRYTLAQIRTLLRRLDGGSADSIESETLECKPWDPDGRLFKEQVRELRETVVCLANASGGAIILGIADGERTRAEAIVGVADLAVAPIRKAVYDGTDPHILVDVEELIEPEGRLLVVHVPRGLGAHTTSEGVAKIRVGKDCQPLTGSMLAERVAVGGQIDRTAQPAPGATPSDLDPEEIKRLQRLLETEDRRSELARQAPQELLENLGLVRGQEVTLAAILLLGRSPALARWAPQHELVFIRYTSRTRYDVRHNFKGPVLAVLERVREMLEAHLRVSTLASADLFELTIPDITWWVVREAILNAVAHRDYFLNQAVYLELRPSAIEVASPGGFIGGVTPQNILRHPPVRRNPLLADALEKAGLVNRAGMGVDRIYEELLRLGKDLPRYEADEATVRLRLPTSTHAAFAQFVAEETRGGRTLDLEDLILLRAITNRGNVDRWSAAEYLQVSEADAAERLAALRERGYLVPQGRGRGTSYHLARAFSDLLRGRVATDDAIPLDDEAVRLRVQAVLGERGRLTNADVRRISGYSRTQTLRLMRSLRDEGFVAFKGRGRDAHYVPGPKLGAQQSRTHRRRRERDAR